MGWLDVVIAKAMQARDWGLTRPAITQDTTSFRGLFNPELRISLEAAGKRFQPVNIRLTTGPTVITGANMSGKTVLLHSVELAQYMLQFGFYIAAEKAEMALVDEVHCSIGDGQDQLSGLSSFAAEMMRMDELYKKRESLMQPIQDEIYNAVKEIATQNGYAAVVDRASASSIIFASPSIDVSNEVLAKLGYSN